MAEFPASSGAKTLLDAHVGVSGWTIKIGQMPDTPATLIYINDTGGDTPNPKWLLDYPSLQVVVRGAVGTYLDTFREARAVKNLLLGADSQDINGDRWVSITMIGELGFIGRDEDERPMFSMNFALIIEPQLVGDSNRLAL